MHRVPSHAGHSSAVTGRREPGKAGASGAGDWVGRGGGPATWCRAIGEEGRSSGPIASVPSNYFVPSRRGPPGKRGSPATINNRSSRRSEHAVAGQQRL